MKILPVVILLFTVTSAALPRERLIQIAVEVAEVDLNKTYQYGISWIDTIRAQEPYISAGTFERTDLLYGELKVLMEKGAADILANPKLVTKNGTTANFSVGGEIPYITSTNQSVNVNFKPYGVSLQVKPTLEQDDYINVQIHTEISKPDETSAVSLSGNTVPVILARSVQSELNVKPGTTITIAGLNQTRKETIKRGIPLLGDIPVIGALFARHKIIDIKTSVVIFLTPTIIQE